MCQYNTSYNKLPLLSFRLEVQDGVFDSLNINEEGNIVDELEMFCQRHHLDDKSKAKLNNFI